MICYPQQKIGEKSAGGAHVAITAMGTVSGPTFTIGDMATAPRLRCLLARPVRQTTKSGFVKEEEFDEPTNTRSLPGS